MLTTGGEDKRQGRGPRALTAENDRRVDQASSRPSSAPSNERESQQPDPKQSQARRFWDWIGGEGWDRQIERNVIELERVPAARRDYPVKCTATCRVDVHVGCSVGSLIAVGAGHDITAGDRADECRAIVEAQGIVAVDRAPQDAEVSLKSGELQSDGAAPAGSDVGGSVNAVRLACYRSVRTPGRYRPTGMARRRCWGRSPRPVRRRRRRRE